MKCVLYLRVSTKDQDYENQRIPLGNFAASRKWDIAKVYAESESAWKQGQQHELEKLKAAARRGEFDILLCWALDRLTRQGSAAILNMVKEYANYGVKVISYQEAFTEQLNPDNAELFIGIAGWLAKMESKRKSERILAASEKTKETGITAKGKKWGRPKGKKDGPDVKRKRSKYVARWENERELNNLPSKTTSDNFRENFHESYIQSTSENTVGARLPQRE